MSNPLANLPATIRGGPTFTPPATDVTFTAECPRCHEDVEWTQGNNNSSVQDHADAAPTCDCETT